MLYTIPTLILTTTSLTTTITIILIHIPLYYKSFMFDCLFPLKNLLNEHYNLFDTLNYMK
jgi:hypothetical protein